MHPLFRIHLSTGIVLMLLASIFLGLNIPWREVPADGFTIRSRGWPLTYSRELSEFPINEDTLVTAHPPLNVSMEELERRVARMKLYANEMITAQELRWHWPVMFNLSVALSVLAFVALLLEARLRRK
jgi:hypothetical protein